MAEKYLYTPTDYIDSSNTAKVVFLGGPIQGAPDWQSTAIAKIHHEKPEVIIASPRRKYLDGEFEYKQQVDGETFHLRRAGQNGIIAFWLPKEIPEQHDIGRAYAQTTRGELFEWKVRHERDDAKLVLGVEDGFSGKKYIVLRFTEDCPDIPICQSLDEVCSRVISLL